MSAGPRFKHPLQAGIAIGRSMACIDPARDAESFMRFRFETAAGEWAWSGHVSEAGAVLIAALLEAEEDRQANRPPSLAVVLPLRPVR